MATWNILRTVGIFFRQLEYFTDSWKILRPFNIFYGPLIRTYIFWSFSLHIFLRFGLLCEEKSGNPVKPRNGGINVYQTVGSKNINGRDRYHGSRSSTLKQRKWAAK
jgi:hypothetical protein